MKKNYSIIILFIFLSIHACKKDSTETKDSIKISSVSPTIGLIDGQTIKFTIKGTYSLISNDSAIIMVGFNNGSDAQYYIMISEKDTSIKKGDGQFNFDVATQIKNWHSEAPFLVYVNISPKPYSSDIWYPYAYDTYPIIPKSR